jgi:hypothetical protein
MNVGATPTKVNGISSVASVRDLMYYHAQLTAALVDALTMVVDHHLDT